MTFLTAAASIRERSQNLIRWELVDPLPSDAALATAHTDAGGFVDGGVIYQGKFESDVGDGISQYATTLFNAAFFGAMDIPLYQSHSIYLKRYPYGREATLSFPEPDLVIYNPSECSVLIWPTYDATSITVTLYGTKVAEVTDTGQNVDSWKWCTRVTTYRERAYNDGTTVDGFFFALYRPSAGYDCDGLPEIGPQDTAE